MSTPNVSTALKQKIIGDYIKTAAGRAKLAASMTQPLRTRRDYMSVGRKTFLVEQLPDGALPIYDKDPDVTAFVVGEEGENILAITKPRRVIFPLFEIASNPEIPLTQIKERRFDLIERSQDLARAMIQAAEDERVFAVLDAIAVNGFDSIPGGTNPDIPVVAPLNGAVLADDGLRSLARSLMDEGLNAARRLGHAIPDSFADWQIERSYSMGDYKPSSMIDYELSRPVEVEAIWGEPWRQGVAAGAAMPRLEALHRIIAHLTRTA